MLRGFALGVGMVALLFVAAYQASVLLAPKPWKRFYNSYVSFTLPPDWGCKVAGTEFVCRGSDEQVARQSIIVLTAKYAGPQDSFEYYRSYLGNPIIPKERDGSDGRPSIIEHLGPREFAGHEWLVGIHDGSLLPRYKSQYYVTISKDVAVLITFSYHAEKGQSLAYIGERVAGSLVVLN